MLNVLAVFCIGELYAAGNDPFDVHTPAIALFGRDDFEGSVFNWIDVHHEKADSKPPVE